MSVRFVLVGLVALSAVSAFASNRGPVSCAQSPTDVYYWDGYESGTMSRNYHDRGCSVNCDPRHKVHAVCTAAQVVTNDEDGTVTPVASQCTCVAN